MRKRVGCAALVVILFLVVSIYWIGASAAYDAEHALWATCAASAASEEYVSRNRKWPTSWEELESVSATVGTVYSWPDDSAEIREYVDVDFGMSLSDVADQNPDDFRAIRPKVPAYQAYRHHFSRLLETVRKVLDGKKDAERNTDDTIHHSS